MGFKMGNQLRGQLLSQVQLKDLRTFLSPYVFPEMGNSFIFFFNLGLICKCLDASVTLANVLGLFQEIDSAKSCKTPVTAAKKL